MPPASLSSSSRPASWIDSNLLSVTGLNACDRKVSGIRSNVQGELLHPALHVELELDGVSKESNLTGRLRHAVGGERRTGLPGALALHPAPAYASHSAPRDSVEIGQRLLEMAPGRIVNGDVAFDVRQRGAFACRVHISSWRAVSSSSTMLGCHDVMIFSFSSRPRVSPARIRAPPSRYPTMSMR